MKNQPFPTEIDATICWMDKAPLKASQKYFIKHGVNDAQAKVSNLSKPYQN